MRLTLRATLILYLAGLQLLAIAAILVPSYLSSERTLMEHARALMRDVAFTTIAHSDRFLAPAEAAAELSKRLAENDIVASDDPDLLEKLLFEQLQLVPQFAGIYYGDEAGNFVYVMRATADAPGPFRSKYVSRTDAGVQTRLIWRDDDFKLVQNRLDPTDRFDPRERPWYQDARRDSATVWTDPYIFYTSKNPGVTVASPILDGVGAIQGVIGVDIEIGAISSFLARLKIGENGRALILNHNGDVIAHPEPSIIKTQSEDGSGGLRFAGIAEVADPIARSAFASMLVNGNVRLPTDPRAYSELDGARYISTSFTHMGADYVATIAPMPHATQPWTIGVYAPKDDFVGALQVDRNRSIVIALAVAAVTAAIGAFLANKVHAPVRVLAERATRISRGGIVPPAPFPTSFVELRRAGIAFNRMSIWLAKSKARNTELHESLKEASLALEARVAARTADLAAVNGRLEAEIATRAKAEETLRNEVRMHADTSARLRVAAAETESANAAKTRFLSSMSHELRSPLNAIIGFTDLLAERNGTLSEQKRHEYLQHVKSSSDHLLALVDDVLDLENVESGQIALKIEAIDPKQALASAILEQSVLADQTGTRIEDETDADLPFVQADANRLRQVLVNMLSNAVKYGPPGSTVTVSSEERGAFLRIVVADSGPGIPLDLQGRLFRPFDRLGAETSNIEGSGVGLALSKQLIESMGGRIGLVSAPGAGSRFWIETPIAATGAVDAAPAAAPAQADRSRQGDVKRILYIDDSPLNLKLIEDFLGARDDMVVVSAETGADGVRLVRNEAFDLYLVDINLPDMSGYDLLREIRRLRPGAKALAVSADAMPAHVERGLKAGFDGYITKPVRLQALAEDIEARLQEAG